MRVLTVQPVEEAEMAENNIIPFTFEMQDIRAVERDGEPWFVLADVCRILEHTNPSQAASRLDEDERNTLTINDGNRGNPNVTIINESGLYSLIMTSRTPNAKRFKKWVTSEVLPSIRKTGSYALAARQAPDELDAIQAMVDAIRENRQRVNHLEKAVENFGAHEDYRSIKAHAALMGRKIATKESGELGRQATALSKQEGRKIGRQPDESFGQVNTYHRDILEKIFEK